MFKAVDLFCGVGGLTRGLSDSGIEVVAGYDLDATCKYAYEANNNAKFIQKDIKEMTGEDFAQYFKKNEPKILVGCAPCQPFSTHTLKLKKNEGFQHKKWGMLYEFGRLVDEAEPDIISMENVPNLINTEVYTDFETKLKSKGYFVKSKIVYCPDYGIPQSRRRLVLLASKHGEISLIEPTYNKEEYVTVEEAIGHLPAIKAGGFDSNDPLHRSSAMNDLNLKRIRASKPGGTWKDWPEELRAKCHLKEGGQTYTAVYARMKWDNVSPTITTQYNSFGTGRYGHPEQDRALSLREGAILQTFPDDYSFCADGEKVVIKNIARHVGNAVPVKLGEVIGISIQRHLEIMGMKKSSQ